MIAHPDDAGELPVAVATLVRDGDTVKVGASTLSVTHLRGHTPGSIALCYDAGGRLATAPHLFTGDSLFPGGPGNTEHDPARFTQLIDDLEDRVFAKLPDATWVYPGHGKDTTLGPSVPTSGSGAPVVGEAAVLAPTSRLHQGPRPPGREERLGAESERRPVAYEEGDPCTHLHAGTARPHP